MSTDTLNCPVTITGLDRLEVSALRHALGRDNPFLDEPISVNIDLAGIIDMLTSVREILYGQDPSPALRKVADAVPSSQPDALDNSKQPSGQLGAKNDTPVTLSVLNAGKGVRWGTVVSELESGNIEEFVTGMKPASASTTKSTLLRKYPGLHVDIESVGNSTLIKVKLGRYES